MPHTFPAGHDDLCAPLVEHRTVPTETRPFPVSSTASVARWCVQTLGAHGPEVQLRQSTGDVTALDRALHAPLTVPGPSNLICPAVGYAAFTLEVLDQHDRRYRPRLPTGLCGDVSGTRDALAHTRFTVPADSRAKVS